VYPNSKGLKDEAKNHLKPIVLAGNAEELDEGFFDVVSQPIQKASGLLIAMKEFEDSLDIINAEKKEAQEQKRNGDKQAQERKSKFDKLIARADNLENEEKHEEALKILREAKTMADGDDVAKTDARIEKAKAKCMQSSLFQ